METGSQLGQAKCPNTELPLGSCLISATTHHVAALIYGDPIARLAIELGHLATACQNLDFRETT